MRFGILGALMSMEDIENIKRGYAAFNDGDVDGLLALLDPEIEWRMPDVHVQMYTNREDALEDIR